MEPLGTYEELASYEQVGGFGAMSVPGVDIRSVNLAPGVSPASTQAQVAEMMRLRGSVAAMPPPAVQMPLDAGADELPPPSPPYVPPPGPSMGDDGSVGLGWLAWVVAGALAGYAMAPSERERFTFAGLGAVGGLLGPFGVGAVGWYALKEKDGSWF